MEQLQKESIKDRNEANKEKKEEQSQGQIEQKEEEEEIDLKAKYCPQYSKYEVVKCFL